MQETNQQSRLVRDQPTNPLNVCPCCMEKPQLYDNLDGSYSLKCSCGHEAMMTMPKLNDLGLQILCTLWNIDTTNIQWSAAMQKQFDVTEGALLVYDLRDYSLLSVGSTFLDAIYYMETLFNESMDQRTALFQLCENGLPKFVMISDELWEN